MLCTRCGGNLFHSHTCPFAQIYNPNGRCGYMEYREGTRMFSRNQNPIHTTTPQAPRNQQKSVKTNSDPKTFFAIVNKELSKLKARK